MTTTKNIEGIISATFTPMTKEGMLDISKIGPMVDRLIDEGLEGLYIAGGTGEGVSLSTSERKSLAEEFVSASGGRIPVIVHVGHNSIEDAKDLTRHAKHIGADAISAMSPTYFRPDSLNTLLLVLQEITTQAPDMPFIYYHIPHTTGVDINVAELLQESQNRIPSLIGVKFTDTRVFNLQHCLEVADGKFKMYYGFDEMMLSGLQVGAHGAIGSTYNFALPLYKRIYNAFHQGEFEKARELQAQSALMIRIIISHGGLAAQKAVMTLINSDCGPTRLPHRPLTSERLMQLEKALENVGFFEWARSD